MRRATQSSNEEQGEFRPNLAGQKRPQIEIAEGHKKKVAVQKGLCGPPPGHPLLLTLGARAFFGRELTGRPISKKKRST